MAIRRGVCFCSKCKKVTSHIEDGIKLICEVCNYLEPRLRESEYVGDDI